MNSLLDRFRIICLILLLSNIIYGQKMTKQEMLEFYPNNIGNSWSYWWKYFDPIIQYSEAGRDYVEISQDTIINNLHYSEFQYHYKSYEDYEKYFERIDTVTGDVYRIDNILYGEEHIVDNLYSGVGDTINISENRYLLYCDKLVVLSFRDTLINNLSTTIRKIKGIPSNRKLFFARNIGMLGYGESFWIDSAKVNENIYGDISIDITEVKKNNKIVENSILLPNYPNPFNPITHIEFAIPKREYIELNVFNSLGQKVKTIIKEIISGGEYNVEFDGSNFSSGIYFYQIKTNNYSNVRKMLLLK